MIHIESNIHEPRGHAAAGLLLRACDLPAKRVKFEFASHPCYAVCRGFVLVAWATKMPPQESLSKLAPDTPSSVDETSFLEADLRSSFVEMVHQALGGERTSSFASNEAELGFALGNHAVEEPAPVPEQIGGRFIVRKEIGRGGFGTVYLAHDQSLDRDVAIKVPHEKLRSDPLLSTQCLKEARLAAKLRHPSIVTIFDISEDEGRIAYIVAEYVRGATLYDLIAQQRFSVKQAILLVIKVAEAIAFAHAHGVYHRDLKPANLIVDETGGIRVLDFGLAVDEEMQRGARGQVAGTIAYMSPEQIEGRTHHLDGRTDLWSLGVIFYELLTGKRPFRGGADEISDQVIRREAAPPRQFLASIPKRVEACCLKCLAKSVASRYATAVDLLDDLREIIETEPLPEDLPSGPLPAAPQNDTKRLAKDTTKEIAQRGVFGRWISWGVAGALLFVALLGLWPMMASYFAETNAPKPPQSERQGQPALEAKSSGLAKPVVVREHDLLETRPEDFLVSRGDPSFALFDEGNFTVQSFENRAELFPGEFVASNYDVNLSIRQIPQWNGSTGVLLGVRKSSNNPSIWVGYLLEIAKSPFDSTWEMCYSQVVINRKSPGLVQSTLIKKTPRLPVPKSGTQLMQVLIRNGNLKGVNFGDVYYVDIALKAPQDSANVAATIAHYGTGNTQLTGRIGLMSNDCTLILNKAVAIEYQ